MMHKTCPINYGHLADLQKALPTIDLNKKKLSFDKISPRDFYFCPFFSICTCFSDCYRADAVGSVACDQLREVAHPNGSCVTSDGEFHGVWNYSAYHLRTENTWVLPSEEYYK